MSAASGAPAVGPESSELRRQIKSRHRRGAIWRNLFLASTILGIVSLTALLYNILNQAFGLIAVENKVQPSTLVLAYQKERLLAAANTEASEDDAVLVDGVAANTGAIGFFGYAYYQANTDRLKLISVEGVGATTASVDDGRYPLARPLYLYTAAEVLRDKPQVAAFINYYLTHVNEEIDAVGYFPASDLALGTARDRWLAANGLAPGQALPAADPLAVSGPIHIGGSSTVFPLSVRLVGRFERAGFPGSITIDNTGTTAGLRALCFEGVVDIADASRPMTRAELEACRAIGREPLEFRVGTDALAIVVHPQNDFLDDLSREELAEIFTTAGRWSDVNPAWPAAPIARYVPGANSGTLDYFAEAIFDDSLADLPKERLVAMLESKVSAGLMRRLENDQPFAERSPENVYALVVERVVEPTIVRTWSLRDSLLSRPSIEVEVGQRYPEAVLEFRAWLNPSFVANPQSSTAAIAGVRTAILGSLWTIAITILFAFPVGVGAAIYLEEYAGDSRVNRIIQTNINNLAGVPSIIYGMLGLAIFVRALESITSGAAFGAVEASTTANGRTILSAGLTLGLLILPVLIISAQEAIRAVPGSLRQASYALGATRWQTIWHHVLPSALSGILTGTILAVSRAIGETAPLVVIGASTFITVDPSGPFAKFTTLPIQIYQWTARPQAEFRNIAAAAIIALLVMLLSLNASAVLLRNRYSRRMA